MDLDELTVGYYHSALNMAQKSLIGGLSIASIAYLVAVTGKGKESYKVPLIDIDVASFDYFAISLLILFFSCGVVCSYAIRKAFVNWKLVNDEKLAARIFHVPNIFLISMIQYPLYGFMLMVASSLSEKLFELGSGYATLSGIILTTPFFIAFRYSSDLKTLNQKANSK